MTLDLAHYPLLALADTPEQLRELPQDKLKQVAQELRQYLLTSVSQSSGHFASGLGTVELTVALHYVFNAPTFSDIDISLSFKITSMSLSMTPLL